jgi:type II secretion system protein H
LTTGRASNRRTRQGFTLLELVLVMVIICTLLGMAAPSLRGFFLSRKTNETADRIIALARLARTTAVSQGSPCRLVVDAGRRTFYLTVGQAGQFERLQTSLGSPCVLPDGVDLKLQVSGAQEGRGYVAFFPDGRAEPATFRLKDIKGGVVEVTCAGPTEPFVVTEPEEAQ